MTDPRRFWVFTPLVSFGGICPVCDGVMDDTGCRLGPSRGVPLEISKQFGFDKLTEVFCRDEPAHPVQPCPSCGPQ